jgi:hypothetical protein
MGESGSLPTGVKEALTLLGKSRRPISNAKGVRVTGDRPKPNTHDTSRQVIILRVGWGPVTNRVPPVTKTVTSINSVS